MPWNKYVGEGKAFATPDLYAQAIERNTAAGKLSDKTAADAFMAQRNTAGTPLRDAYQGVSYDPQSRQVGVGGANFQSGQIPGTNYTGGQHYVTDRNALQAAIDAQLNKTMAPQQPAATPAATPAAPGAGNITDEYTPAVSSLLGKLMDYIGTPHQTPDQVLQSDYGRQLMAATERMRDEQNKYARAQLAGSGALYPDDTRAAERFAEVGANIAGMQAGQILPQLLSATQGQRAMGLNELQAGLGAHSNAEAQALNRILQTFQTYAPYTMGTWDQVNRLPLDWTHAMGQVPGGAQPGGGGTVPARQYVEQKGGQISHRKDANGSDIVTINGHDIAVQSIPGAYIENGRTFLPQWAIDQALGG